MTTMIKLSDNYYVRGHLISAISRADGFVREIPVMGTVSERPHIVVTLSSQTTYTIRFDTIEERDEAFDAIIKQL